MNVATDRPDGGYPCMSFETALTRSPSPTRDREIIRVDVSDDRLGIAASLRQAFAATSHDECTRDFEKLINELN